MLVKELIDSVDVGERTIPTKLSDVKATEDGLVIGDNKPIELDDTNLPRVAKYLNINPKYLQRCPQDLRLTNINHWLDHYKETDAVFHMFGGELHTIHKPERKIVPVKAIAEVVAKKFDENDEVLYLGQEPGRLHLDITSPRFLVDIPGSEGGISDRPGRGEVGDITHGGVRLFAFPGIEQDPYAQTYLNRLVCTNGMAIREPEHTMTLKGNTVDDLLKSMEDTFEALLQGMDNRLEQYRKTAEVEVEGSVEQMVLNMAKERGIGTKLQTVLVERVPELGPKPSVYDVLQLFTRLANETSRYSQRIRLQRIGGDLSSQTEHMLHRCTNCQHALA
ncbi:hypothetical protein [Streptomyces sp. CoH17]|uniref:hypothetical protein n=1 Tax=Streptomyces sp. CoH17 TaxID=2992806 RepID=UPI00226DF1FA|nr:hypothetical protein [Streptomyces sp. CoH17]